MSNHQKKLVDPVFIVMLGVVFVAISIVLIIFGSNSTSLAAPSGPGVMGQLVIAFMTGITTGGLSCLAVQEGLAGEFSRTPSRAGLC